MLLSKLLHCITVIVIVTALHSEDNQYFNFEVYARSLHGHLFIFIQFPISSVNDFDAAESACMSLSRREETKGKEREDKRFHQNTIRTILNNILITVGWLIYVHL